VRGGGNRKGRTGNGNDRTQNGSLALTALISSRDLIKNAWLNLFRMC
jgi:hypothetical protein